MTKSLFRNSSKRYFFNACFDKNQLKNLISWLLNQSGEKITVDFLEKLKQLGFHQATKSGISLGVDDLQIPPQKSILISQAKSDVSLYEQQLRCGNITSVEKSQQLISTWNQTSENLKKATVQNYKNTNQVNPVYMMAFSGARGNISQVRQLVALRGLMADPQGGILEFPIQSNFREGLTLTEYLISCYGARKGLVDTALRTATSGYLTRRLVDVAQHIIISIKDCKTTHGILLPFKNLEQNLKGRVLAKNLQITPSFMLKRNQVLDSPLSKLVSKHLKQEFIRTTKKGKVKILKGENGELLDPRFCLVRSPLTCEVENSLCQFCYGWNLAHGKLVTLGEAVGIIAAQSIGEPGTQLTMRTFHTGGVGVFSDQAMNYFVVPYDGIIEYPEGLPGHFVRTPYGKIVYMIKNTIVHDQEIILQLKSHQTKQINYSIKYQELPPGSILLVRQGEHVKSGTIIAQSSQITKSRQKMPDSTYPIFSTLDGEIHFESMDIKKENFLELQKLKAIKNKKQKKKKQEQKDKIGPDIQTLKRVGSFWIFSSENQQEVACENSFLRPGDLVSSQSSIFQFNLYVQNRSIFSTIFNKSCIGLDVVSLANSQTNFHKNSYSITLKNHLLPIKQPSISNEIFFFQKKGVQNFLIWYPSQGCLPSSGYCLNLLMYAKKQNRKSEIITNINVLTTSKNFKKNTIYKTLSCFQGSAFYLPKKIKKSKIMYPDFLKNSPKTSYLDLKNFNRKKSFSVGQSNLSFSNLFQQFYLLPKKELKKKIPADNIQFFLCTQKNYLIDSVLIKKNDFTTFALQKVKTSLYSKSSVSLGFFQQNNGWIFVPKTTQIFLSAKEMKKLLVFEKGKFVDAFIFFNFKICVEVIPCHKIGLLKSLNNQKSNQLIQKNWYCCESFLIQDAFLETRKIKLDNFFNSVSDQNFSITSSFTKCFSFYKLNQKKSKKYYLEKIKPIERSFHQLKTNVKQLKKNFVCIYPVFEYTLPKKSDLLKQWISFNKIKTSHSSSSPLFTKQQTTCYDKEKIPTKKFQIFPMKIGGWHSSKILFKFLINFNSQSVFKKICENYFLSTYLKKSRISVIGFKLFFYDVLLLPKTDELFFQVFENRWVLPNTKLTTGFIKIKNEGEFRRFKFKQTTSITCLLTPKNVVSVKLKPNNTRPTDIDIENFTKNIHLPIGLVFRSGTEIFPGITSSTGGLIISKNFDQINIRRGFPFLASRRGLVHIFDKDLIQKGDLLVTLKSRRLQTQDIVQGIPKIEQLFEARESLGGERMSYTLSDRLRNYFNEELKPDPKTKQEKNSQVEIFDDIIETETKDETIQTWYDEILLIRSKYAQFLRERWGKKIVPRLIKSTRTSLDKFQFFLVEQLNREYSNQGVNLSRIHFEVIVREMTSFVCILDGGQTGLLQGEIVKRRKIEQINQKIACRAKKAAVYEPLVLGLTKSVLQSESFLLSASFQEVSRVLVRSALANKKDFLRGLHENVIIGQLIPAGTGLVKKHVELAKKHFELDKKNSTSMPQK